MTKRNFKLVLLLTILGFYSNSYSQNVKLIHAGTLLAVPGEAPQSNKTLVIERGMISEVRDGFLNAKDLGKEESEVEIIDLKKSFVLPGLIDLHVHITGERNPAKTPHLWTTLNRADLAYDCIPYLNRTIDAGFTTVRDLGAEYQLINAVQRAVKLDLVDGPRIFAATGAVSATGGHGDFHGYRAEIMNAMENSVGICDGSDDCRRAVRALVKQGADVIKITATGGVLSNTAAGVGQQLTDDELVSIVETAHSLGRKVAAHAHEADGINAALRAGVNTIEHGSYLNDESVELFNKSGAYLVPTLLAGITMLEEMKVNDKIPPAIVQKIVQVGPVVEASFKRALAGNVKIAFGTDSGVSKHGTNAREFEIMVDYGMDPAKAIQSATVTAAEVLDMSDKLGTLEKGKLADIIAVQENPIENISSLQSVKFVMKEGKIYKD